MKSGVQVKRIVRPYVLANQSSSRGKPLSSRDTVKRTRSAAQKVAQGIRKGTR